MAVLFIVLLFMSSPAIITVLIQCFDYDKKRIEKRKAEEDAQQFAKIREEQEKIRLEKQRLDEIDAKIRAEEQMKAEEQAKEAERIAKERLYEQFNNELNNIPKADIAITENPPKNKFKISNLSVKFSNITSRSNFNNLSSFVVLDVETTGLKATQDKITELSAIKYIDFEPVECFTTLINPCTKIPDNVIKLNGITNESVSECPTIYEVLPNFIDFVGESNIIGYNLFFDLKFLYSAGYNFLEYEKRKYYDVMQFAMKKLKTPRKIKKYLYDDYDDDSDNDFDDFDNDFDNDFDDFNDDYSNHYSRHKSSYYEFDYSDYDVENYKLTTVAEYYGIYRNNAHHSLSDCYATAQIYEKLVRAKLNI